MVEQSVKSNSNGVILLDESGNSIKMITNLFGLEYRPKKVMVVCTGEKVDSNLLTLIGKHIAYWVKRVTLVEDSIPKCIATAFHVNRKLDLTFIVECIESGFKLQCMGRNGLIMTGKDITQLLHNVDESLLMEETMADNTKAIVNITVNEVYRQLENVLSLMVLTPAIEVFECTDMKFLYMVGSKPIYEYVGLCAHLFSFKFETKLFSKNHDRWKWSTENLDPVIQFQMKLGEYDSLFDDHDHEFQLSLRFCITPDGQQMATVAMTKTSFQSWEDHDICLLLLWWSLVRRRYERELSQFKNSSNENDLNVNEKSDNQITFVGPASLIDNPQIMELVGKNSEISFYCVEDSDQIISYVGQMIQPNQADWTNVVGCDHQRRFLFGSAKWDAVAVSIQLVQMAIFCKSICGHSINQLLFSLQTHYSGNEIKHL
ncbi:hypothetical protein BLOT_004845 [Blomia tropicalis]|nr:hypothetical protein BLOT_004845 [Blomia tropicalis]